MSSTQSDVEEFRREARAWIEANLEPWRGPRGGRVIGDAKTPDKMAAARLLQRKLFDGGYAGISYPAEYGGRGLTSLHERAFREEARGYVRSEERRVGKE